MPVEFANHAAAVAAGYTSILHDKGVAAVAATRYLVTLEKHLTGISGQSGGPFRAYGEGASQAAAEAQALASLNKMRDHKFGGAPGREDTDANSTDIRGGVLVTDVT